jgi:ADP-glucose pyrophosphorylase
LSYILVACQVGLYLGAATTNKVLDVIIATKDLSSSLIAKGLNIEQSVEQCVVSKITSVRDLASVSILLVV